MKNYISTIRPVSYTLLLFSVLWSGCKKDNSPDNSQQPTNTILPKPGTYTYHSHGSDGTDGDQVTTYSQPKDSANGKVEHVQNSVDTLISQGWVYADANNTIYEMAPPEAYWSIVNTLQSEPGVTNYSITGWPMYMVLANQPTTSTSLIFNGGPIHMHVEGATGNQTFSDDWTMKYTNGKVVALNQKVTTDAGTFTCTEWAYDFETDFYGQAGGVNVSQTQVFNDTLWYALGVGPVKTTGKTPTSYGQTILKKIQ
jgi:hypothetical protein